MATLVISIATAAVCIEFDLPLPLLVIIPQIALKIHRQRHTHMIMNTQLFAYACP